MRSLSENACAKINLYLDITGKRADGYHELASVMQSVSLADTVTITETSDGILRFSCSDPALAGDENLVVRAAKLFYQRVGVPFGGLLIALDKKIPVAAGLAGGSTDAAAVLRGLDRLHGTALGPEKLCAIGLELGADVPFCIRGGAAICTGIGDQMRPVPGLAPGTPLVIAKGAEGVSTKDAYAAVDDMLGEYKGRSAAGADAFVSRLAAGDPDGFYNIFEPVISARNPMVPYLVHRMKELGAFAARMSGSGPSVFGIFPDEASASRAADLLRKESIFAASCTAM